LSEWINRIHVGHCLDILKRMPADLVDTVVTSPPYWNSVRDYGDDTGANWGDWNGQLGHEPDPLQFVEHILQVTRELKRVLKPTGSLFLNFGDGYYHGPEKGWLRPKQLLGIPWRVAIAMQDEGWILRNDLVWWKINSMPTSSVDKWKPSHEHVFFFTKEPSYYFDIRTILAPLSEGSLKRINQRNALKQMGGEKQDLLQSESIDKGNPLQSINVMKGLAMRNPEEWRHPEDVLNIPAHGFPGSHFATFPEELVEPFVKAACPREVCRTCGKPRMRLWETIAPEGGYKGTRNVGGRTDGYMTKLGDITEIKATWKFIGWSDCGCGGGWTRGVLLDPFAGSGTALKVARRLGRNFIGIDIKEEYVQMARGRLRGEVRKTQGASRLIDFNNSNFTISDR
jgi:DNA modification methylase